MAPCVPFDVATVDIPKLIAERVVAQIKASPEWAAYLAEETRLVLYGTGEGEPQGLIRWEASR